MLKLLWGLLVFCSISAGHAMPAPLPESQAFDFKGYINQDKQLMLQWNIAPHYYLYRDRLTVVPLKHNAVRIGNITLPPSQTKKDTHAVYQVYSNTLNIAVPLLSTKGILAIAVEYQGCSEQGFCYPPVKKNLEVSVAKLKPAQDMTPYFMKTAKKPITILSEDRAEKILDDHHIYLILLTYFFFGVLLAFTPCVLPMVPILSSIIVDQAKHLNTKKAFFLSLSYVLGMALAYSAAGIVIALMGSSVQIALQQPWVIIVFSGLFVLLALSLFGLYDIKLPNRWHQKLAAYNQKHQGGTYVGVFLMGAFSTLIISPCVSAPLVGALAYIGNSGNVWLGGTALFSLGLGMGLPLLLIGTSAGKLLPKTGAWMDKIKQLFGLLMLSLAIWMLGRILPATVSLFLWAMLVVAMAIFMWQIKHSKTLWNKLHQGVGLLILIYGFVLMGGAVTGHTDLFELLNGKSPATHPPIFFVVKNMGELNDRLSLAKQEKKQVLLDFYADWCASCIIMDNHVFARPEVKAALANFVLLRADITQNNFFDRALLKRFQVIAPPTIIFFNAGGEILAKQKIIGEVSSKDLLSNISQVRESPMSCESSPRSC